MCKFIPGTLCLFSLNCLVPPPAEGICQNTFTYYSKEHFKRNHRMLDMEAILIVMLDLCSSYKHKLRSQKTCVLTWPWVAYYMLSLFLYRETTCTSPCSKDVYAICLPYILSYLACSKCWKNVGISESPKFFR